MKMGTPFRYDAAEIIGVARIFSRQARSRVCKKRVISEIARNQYSSCTSSEKKRRHQIVFFGGRGRCRRPTSVSFIGKREQGIENDQVETRAVFAPPLLAPCNHRFRPRCRRYGFRSREAGRTGRQGLE